MSSPWLEARNILAVRLDNIGDVVMLGPALRAVKQASPDARITLLGSPAGVMAADLLPWVDDTITWQPVWQDINGHIHLSPERERELPGLLARRNFDAALIFTSFSQTPHVPGYACYLAGIPLRAGEPKDFGGMCLTDELRGSPDGLHQVERNLRLIERLGFPVEDRDLEVSIPTEARLRADQLLHEAGINPLLPFVLLHPGASCQARRYPPERFGAIAASLTTRGHQVLVTGTEREAPTIQPVFDHAPEVPRLIGRTSLPEFAALVERAAVVTCGNTLPIHIADAVGTPLVVLYSGTDLESQWRPRRVPNVILRKPTSCHPCYLMECPIGLSCLDISEDEIVVAVENLTGIPVREKLEARGA